MTPLEIDNKVCEEFGITGDIDAEELIKHSYVKTQLDEIRKALYRQRIDHILAVNQLKLAQDNKESEAVLSQYQAKVSEYRHNIRQFTASVKTLIELVDELESAE